MEIKKLVSESLESNTYVLELESGAIIIDAGAKLERVRQHVKGQILGVLITHGHFDHITNLDAYAEGDFAIFVGEGAEGFFYNSHANYGEAFILKTPKERFTYLKDDGGFELGGVEIKYFSAPGHSEDSVVYLINGELFTGDVLFAKGVGRTDLITGDKQKLLESLKKIDGLEFKNIHPGHGDSSTREEQNRNLAVFIKFLGR